MAVADGRVHIRYQDICSYRDEVGWYVHFWNALINVMIINKCLFNASISCLIRARQQNGVMNKKTWHRNVYIKIFFHVCNHDIVLICNILTTPCYL